MKMREVFAYLIEDVEGNEFFMMSRGTDGKVKSARPMMAGTRELLDHHFGEEARARAAELCTRIIARRYVRADEPIDGLQEAAYAQIEAPVHAP